MSDHQGDNIQHVEEFAARLRSFCGDLSVLPGNDHDEHVRGSVMLHRLGRFDTLDIDCDLSEVVRDRPTTAREGGHYFFFVHQRAGTSVFDQAEHHFEAHAGSFFMIDDTVPFRMANPRGPVQQYSLHIPRFEMPSDLLLPQLVGASVVPNGIIGSMMCHLVGEVMKAREDEDQLSKAAEAFFDLLRLHLRAVRRESNTEDLNRYHLTIFAKAHHIIDSNFRASNFRASDLAETLNIPMRQLQRAFAQSGQTPSRAIIERRLAFAKAKLESSGSAVTRSRISTIAYESGFSDLSYFYRQFWDRYGYSPGHWRREERAVDSD